MLLIVKERSRDVARRKIRATLHAVRHHADGSVSEGPGPRGRNGPKAKPRKSRQAQQMNFFRSRPFFSLAGHVGGTQLTEAISAEALNTSLSLRAEGEAGGPDQDTKEVLIEA